jgi:predicted enzyme related to lactoylglutathione lyase
MAKVTGIGGIFFKSKNDAKALSAWYQQHLGITLEAWGGGLLKWTEDKSDDGGVTVWNVADKDSKWFEPSDSSFMVNYRVDNLDELIEQFKASGIPLHKGPEVDFNGKFAWIIDPDGNKIELWQACRVTQ